MLLFYKLKPCSFVDHNDDQRSWIPIESLILLHAAACLLSQGITHRPEAGNEYINFYWMKLPVKSSISFQSFPHNSFLLSLSFNSLFCCFFWTFKILFADNYDVAGVTMMMSLLFCHRSLDSPHSPINAVIDTNDYAGEMNGVVRRWEEIFSFCCSFSTRQVVDLFFFLSM